jgi:prepilin-type N-terminal cleavage/methylation domain-containing protein
MTPRCAKARHKGMSVLELLVVLAIAAIAAALMLPQLGRTDAHKLRAAARLLQADLAWAQSESIAHGDDPRVVVFDTAAGRYHVAAKSQPALALAHPSGSGSYVVTYGSGPAADLAGVAISGLAAGGDSILGFGVLGQLDQSSPATIDLSAGELSLTVTADPDTGETTVSHID